MSLVSQGDRAQKRERQQTISLSFAERYHKKREEALRMRAELEALNTSTWARMKQAETLVWASELNNSDAH